MPAEQLRLEGIVAPLTWRLSPATILLGRVRLAECRKILTEAQKVLDQYYVT